MEMKNSTRNRWLGYFGIAVATLLTPAGKLISSAVAAAATVAALINMSDPEVDLKKSPVSAHATSTDHIDEYITNKSATVSDQSILVIYINRSVSTCLKTLKKALLKPVVRRSSQSHSLIRSSRSRHITSLRRRKRPPTLHGTTV